MQHRFFKKKKEEKKMKTDILYATYYSKGILKKKAAIC